MAKILGILNLFQIKSWREEIEYGKQSIYIAGKTSSGKSKFLNNLLDKEFNDELFKTSTRVETGTIQTLEHCSSKESSYASIKIKSEVEFALLDVPEEIRFERKGLTFTLPLNSITQIKFLREAIITKTSDKKNVFHATKAIDRVDIKYPMKLFKDFKIIDTPGLASSESGTDNAVKKDFVGRSYVFWFFDASDIENSLRILEDNKSLFDKRIDRVVLLGNRIDLIDLEDYGGIKFSVILEEMAKKVMGVVCKEVSTLFISLKHIKKHRGITSFMCLKNLEKDLLQKQKNTDYGNIGMLAWSLEGLLSKLSTNKGENIFIDKDIKRYSDEIKELRLDCQKTAFHKSDAIDKIQHGLTAIKEIPKEKNLNTHERFEKYRSVFDRMVSKYGREISNLLHRNNCFKSPDLENELLIFKGQIDLSLKEKEHIFKQYFRDKELADKKDKLFSYIEMKKNILEKLKKTIEKDSYNYVNDKEKDISELNQKVDSLKKDKREFQSYLCKVGELKTSVQNIKSLLLDDLESDIAIWEPLLEDDQSKLDSFFKLYSLLGEHTYLEKKTF